MLMELCVIPTCQASMEPIHCTKAMVIGRFQGRMWNGETQKKKQQLQNLLWRQDIYMVGDLCWCVSCFLKCFFQRLWNTFTCFGQMFLGRGNGGYPLTNVLKLPNFTRHHADSQRVTRLSLKIWMGCTRPVISTPYFKVLHSRVITPLSGWNTQLPNYFRPHIGLAISMYNDRLETPTLYRPHGLIGCQCLVVQFHGKKCRRNLDLDGFQEISS